jgi:tetratricopeptide (TPR) repeat protein
LAQKLKFENKILLKMKTKYNILVLSLFLTASTFAQKDELKALKKLYAKEKLSVADLTDYKNKTASLDALSLEESDKVYSNFYKSMLPLLEVKAIGNNATAAQLSKFINLNTISELASGLNATLAFEKKSGKEVYSKNITDVIYNSKPLLWNYVVELDGQKKYKEVSQVANLIYQLDKKDQERLYVAAEYAYRAKDYDTAISMFNELNAAKYTGEFTSYMAKSKVSDQFDAFSSLAERDLAVKIGTHTNPKVEKTPSKKGDIYRTLVDCYISKNDIPGAKAAIAEAKKVSPDDTSLVMAEANLYLQTNDTETYKKLITEVLAKNPNDADLLYNLGVISSKTKEGYAEAEKYYLKAIAIDPKYKNAYTNLVTLKLEDQTKIVNDINAIKGTSPAENKKYDALKLKLGNVYKSVLPYLEKVNTDFPEDNDVKSQLLFLYNALDMTDKFKALKAKK